MLAQKLNARYETLGIGEGVSDTQSDLIENVLGSSLITLILLLLMAFLLALVGGLGLAGTMSMNVMERTREIGVLRAMGASNRAIWRIVLTEGLVVCGLSWLLGTLLSYSLGMVLSDAVLLAIMQSKSAFCYSWEGAVVWLGLITIITIFACLAPAQRASRLTVREVLAYE
jgi:putative ABC transport system permease protein